MKNTARQQEAMKQQTIGVEVEMNNIRRDAAAKLAADFFGTGRYKNTAADNGYYCWSAWDDKDREWKFQNARWSPRSLPTTTSKPCRSW